MSWLCCLAQAERKHVLQGEPSSAPVHGAPLSATSAPPTLGQPKGGSASQDRKIPPPIGTERLARIRQGGSVAQAPVGTGFVAPVGHSGIWSFGVNAMSGTVIVPSVWRDIE